MSTPRGRVTGYSSAPDESREEYMRHLSKSDIISIGFMMFSIFFGAGNLIFPPSLGQVAGTNLWPAMAGFLTTGVGLPLLGIIAIALVGGDYPAHIAKRVAPWFAALLLGLLYLSIGPLFAIPRTGAVSFEIGIRPFLSAEMVPLGQAIYTGVFFLLTYWLAHNPGKLIDRVGKMLTPALLLFLIVLFIRTFTSPLGPIQEPQGAYLSLPFVQGFQNGYLTMDLLASVAVGSIVVTTIQRSGITEPQIIGRACFIIGVIAVVLMALVYLSLAYLGATSTQTLGIVENGGIILTQASALLFGAAGQSVLALIIALACLTTSCGMLSAFASYFADVSKGRLTYEHLSRGGAIFGFAAANIGLTGLIQISIPFLVALYPIVIMLVLLTLLDRLGGGSPYVYRCSLAFTALLSVYGGLKEAGISWGWLDAILTRYLPLYGVSLGWLVPALFGAALGSIFAFACRRAPKSDKVPVKE